MYPILLSFGPVTIYTFGLFLALAFIFGTFTVWHYGREEAGDEKILDFLLLFILLTFFFGRVFYILFHLDIFGLNLLKMLHIIKYPGLFLEAGIFFSFLISFFYLKKHKINPLSLFDTASVGFTLSLLLGEIGCFLQGCTLGTKTNFFLGVTLNQILGKRHPVSLYQSFFNLIIFLILLFLVKYKYHQRKIISKKNWNLKNEGLITGIFIVLFSFSRFLFGFFVDEEKTIFNLSISQYSNLIILLIAIIFLIRYINWENLKLKIFRKIKNIIFILI